VPAGDVQLKAQTMNRALFPDRLIRRARSRIREPLPVGEENDARRGSPIRSCLGRFGRAGLVATVLLAGSAARGADEPPRAALDEARKVSNELVTSVRSELLKAIEASGPLRAIVVCKYTVPEIASALSRRHGARITRVSLTPRNPALGWGDAWEQKVLIDFDERVARRFLRYMKALPMQPVCLSCHGAAEQLSESIRTQLAHDYPHDRATGLQLGKVRGAVTYKKPL
jgi:Protein of unknown function (DUF3365)